MARSSIAIDSDTLRRYQEPTTSDNSGFIIDFEKPHQYVDVKHSQLAYWRVGSGPNLILVHGWPISSATYRNLLPYLSKHFTCHMFDLPGAGKTNAGAKAPFGLSAHAQTLLTAIRSVGINHYALLGHDSGAAIMQILASADKKNVSCLVMGNTETPGYHSFMMKLLLFVAKYPSLGELLFYSLRFKWLRHSILGFGGAFKDKQFIEGSFARFFINPLIYSRKVRKNQLKFLKSFNLNDVSKLISIQKNLCMPIQLQWGSDDPFFY